MSRKPEVVEVCTLPIDHYDYSLVLHEETDTIPCQDDSVGLCDHLNKTIHLSAHAFIMSEDGKSDEYVPDWDRTRRVLMHELGHALWRESSAVQVLNTVNSQEALAEFSVVCMEYWDKHGEQLKSLIMPHLKRWGEQITEEEKQNETNTNN